MNPQRPKKILVADDDRVVLYTLCKGLRDAGFEVIEARNGVQALALCQSEAPDIALLDIRMPGLDGLELAVRLRDETTVPYLFLSAYSDEDLVRRAVELGAQGYLIKPLMVSAIVPTLLTAMARSKDISGLRGAMTNNRNIALAVGILMSDQGLDQQAAIEILRQQARAQRRKLEDLALGIINSNQPRQHAER